MLTSQLIFGVFIVAMAFCFNVVARRTRRVTHALASTLRNPDVKRLWIERHLPQCLALDLAIRIGVVCVGLIGLAIVYLAVCGIRMP
jgi:hypothetical protein